MSNSTNCIWLVDDDEDDLMLIQAAFQNADPSLQIRTLHDGGELLPELQMTQSSPHLVLLDLNMAHTSGFEALSILRSAGRYGHLPIVVLTTSTNPADRHRSQALGANDYHTKPDNFQDLAQLARRLIHQWLPQPVAIE